MNSSSAPHPLASDVGWLLSRVWLGFGDERDRALQKMGITVREHVLMHVLSQVDATQLELAAVIRLDKSVLTTTIDALERKGYVTRIPDASDRRAKRPRLTARGRAACTKADRLSATVQNDLLALIPTAVRDDFVTTLRDLALGPFAESISLAQRRESPPS